MKYLVQSSMIINQGFVDGFDRRLKPRLKVKLPRFLCLSMLVHILAPGGVAKLDNFSLRNLDDDGYLAMDFWSMRKSLRSYSMSVSARKF